MTSTAPEPPRTPRGPAITADRRLLVVHAHPDDESLGTGVTMARYVAEGAHVTLVTCTLGEEGEVLVPDLAHLAADRDDALGPHRAGELADAMGILGVTDQRQLGGPGRYRDSGMAGLPTNDAPGSFWRADLLEAASELVSVIREVRPQVAVTYDDFGAYGHPDHVQAHRVTTYAVALAAAPSFRPDLGAAWEVAKVYWTALSRQDMADGIRALQASDESGRFETMDPDNLQIGVDSSLITTRVEGVEHLPAKLAALRAFPTQIEVDGFFFALSDHVGERAFGVESYRLVHGVAAPGPDGVEDDLFAGLGPA